MAAINPSQLKMQCAEVSDQLAAPEQLIQKLHQLLDHYADRVRRPGKNNLAGALPSYQVPTPVLRALEREFRPQLERSPSQGLQLVDALWQEEWLETRVLAASFLGAIPPINAQPILDRLSSWVISPDSDGIRSAILRSSLARVLDHDPEKTEQLFQNLLQKPTPRSLQAVLFGLNYLADHDSYQNLPFIFQLLSSILEPDDQTYIKEISTLLRALIQRSELEAFFFLKHQLTTAGQPRITRVVRAVLPSFSEHHRMELKRILRDLT